MPRSLQFFRAVGRFLHRVGIILVGFMFTAISAMAAYFDFDLLSDTSYRLVSIFLILIVLSNLLAKLGIAYVNG